MRGEKEGETRLVTFTTRQDILQELRCLRPDFKVPLKPSLNLLNVQYFCSFQRPKFPDKELDNRTYTNRAQIRTLDNRHLADNSTHLYQIRRNPLNAGQIRFPSKEVMPCLFQTNK